ncbi:MAG: hypothetical protein ACK4J0_03730 [Candidatus Anstonellaceae archaeon]
MKNILFYLLAVFLVSFFTSVISIPILIRKLKGANIFGIDVHKQNKPQIPEMGGFSLIISTISSLLFAIFLHTFFGFQFKLIEVLAAMLTFCIISLIGIFDDLFELRQSIKFFLPMIASLPLIALNAAQSTSMFLPFIGNVDFGLFYIIFLIPLGVTVASNLTNTLAGFNGLESGLGIIIFSTLLFFAIFQNNIEMGLISSAMLGGLLVFFYFNKYPAKVFPGDVGNLAIGSALACAVIIGNFESLGALLVAPHAIDILIKAFYKFPKTFGELKDGKLYPPEGKVKGLAHLIMKLKNGISEQELVLSLFLFELLFVLISILLFLKI